MEVRDPIYGFIEYNETERSLINSRPFQRLRHIHQLALTSLIYPSATHKRFDHSLGVMEAATRVFDRVFSEDGLKGPARDRLSGHLAARERSYWRQVLRLAALLHDVGHLPFSHAAERDLLPDGWDHERMTAEMIRGSEIADLLSNGTPPINVEHVIDIAWQPGKRARHEPDRLPNEWPSLLGEIITGDSFGMDRADYLLRDSYHAGVAYGSYDVHRLISGLTVEVDETGAPVLAIEYGSIHAAEALLLARYFMYTQVYMHRLRRIYDEHLKDFMVRWLDGGRFTGSWFEMVEMDDNRVNVAMWKASGDAGCDLHGLANRIVRRQHFKAAYELNPAHKRLHPTILGDAYASLVVKFGEENVRQNSFTETGQPAAFRVKNADGNLSYGNLVSPDVIVRLPAVDVGFIFVEPSMRDEARQHVEKQFMSVFAGRRMRRIKGD